MKKKLILLVLTLTIVLMQIPFLDVAAAAPEIKNVIVLIPDGGGYNPWDFANMVKMAGGMNEKYPNSTPTTKDPMTLKSYLAGSVKTNMYANQGPTDSAAAATALSTGYKTKSKHVGVDHEYKPHAHLAEAAQEIGKATGIVVTRHWTDATPAGFGTHTEGRKDYWNIYQQMENQGFDVVLGPGFGSNADDYGATKQDAIDRGYTLINNKTEMNNIKPGDKVWGNLTTNQISLDYLKSASTPSLAEMTEAAIRALSGDEDEFFLMVEAGSVDSGTEYGDMLTATSEYLAFDAAFKAAVDFAKSRNDTVVIGVPDHDSGGLILDKDVSEEVEQVRNGVKPTTLTWTDINAHSSSDCPVWMYVPEGVDVIEGLTTPQQDSENVRKNYIIENTDIPLYIADLFGMDLDEATKELFVNVTDMGTVEKEAITSTSKSYDKYTFTFNDADVKVTANESWYFEKGKKVEMDGKLAVYVNGQFYVPESLLEDMGLIYRTISFDANGGSGAPAGISALDGRKVTIPSVEPKKTGFAFVGWSDAADGQVKYLAGDEIAVSGDMTLYAVWEEALSRIDDFESYGISEGEYKELKSATGSKWKASSSSTKVASAYLTKQNGNSYAVFKDFKADTLIDKYLTGGKSSLKSAMKMIFTYPGISDIEMQKNKAYRMAYDFRYTNNGKRMDIDKKSNYLFVSERVTSWVGDGFTSDPSVSGLTASNDQTLLDNNATAKLKNDWYHVTGKDITLKEIKQKSGYSAASSVDLEKTALNDIRYRFDGVVDPVFEKLEECFADYVAGGSKDEELKAVATENFTSWLVGIQICLDNVEFAWEGEPVEITVNVDENGTIKYKGEGKVSGDVISIGKGGILVIDAEPDEYYEVDKATLGKINGEIDGEAKTVTFEKIREGGELNITFKKTQTSVKFGELNPAMGTVKVNGAFVKEHDMLNIEAGTPVKVVAEPAKGYKVQSINFQDKTEESTEAEFIASGTYAALTVEFAPVEISIRMDGNEPVINSEVQLENVCVVVAEYADFKLSSAKISKMTLNAGDTKLPLVQFDGSLKIMVWADGMTLRPLCNAYSK